jgi:hypothetical protein
LTLTNSTISGNVGLGSNTSHTFTNSSITGTTTNPVSSQANTDAINASSQAAGLTPTGSVQGSGTALTFTGQAGQNVANLTGINLTNGTFTITGNSTETFVFNVSGAMTLTNSSIKLNGVSANHVLFNVTGGSVTLSNSHANGTFLDLNGAITVSNDTSDTGAFISENAITITNSHLNGSPMVAAAPEMPTIVMAGLAGLLVLGKLGLDRRRHRRAATAPAQT